MCAYFYFGFQLIRRMFFWGGRGDRYIYIFFLIEQQRKKTPLHFVYIKQMFTLCGLEGTNAVMPPIPLSYEPEKLESLKYSPKN